MYKLVSMQGGFFTAEYHKHILTSKLYGLSYYPVSWMEDKACSHQTNSSRHTSKDYGFSILCWRSTILFRFAGGHIPGIEVRPGVILMGYNIASMIGYVLYYKYLSHKLGFKDPEKMKVTLRRKSEPKWKIQLKTKEIREKSWFEGWEERFFLRQSSKNR